MRSFARLIVSGAMALFSLGLATGAQASTVTIGSPLPVSSVFGSVTCLNSTGCVFTHLSLPEPVAIVRAPFDGVIVRWRIKGAKSVDGYALRDLRNTGGLNFTDLGSSAPVKPGGEGLEVFSSHLSVHAGDYVGVFVPETGVIGFNPSGGKYGYLGTTFIETGSATAIENDGELLFDADLKGVPTVTLIGPASGPVAGGTSVTIAGTDFSAVSAVRFGGLTAQSFQVDSEGKITAVAPPAASTGPVDVSVTTDAGTSALNPGDRFEYLAPPKPSSCVVPNLKGKKLKAAKKRAKGANCAIGTVKKLNGATGNKAKVVSQSPRAGKTVAGGTKISVKLR